MDKVHATEGTQNLLCNVFLSRIKVQFCIIIVVSYESFYFNKYILSDKQSVGWCLLMEYFCRPTEDPEKEDRWSWNETPY